MDWRSNFDEQGLKDIDFCREYRQLPHGTLGQRIREIVAKMESILDKAESIINKEPEKIPEEV